MPLLRKAAIVELVRYTLGFYASEPVGLADVKHLRECPPCAKTGPPQTWLLTRMRHSDDSSVAVLARYRAQAAGAATGTN